AELSQDPYTEFPSTDLPLCEAAAEIAPACHAFLSECAAELSLDQYTHSVFLGSPSVEPGTCALTASRYGRTQSQSYLHNSPFLNIKSSGLPHRSFQGTPPSRPTSS